MLMVHRRAALMRRTRSAALLVGLIIVCVVVYLIAWPRLESARIARTIATKGWISAEAYETATHPSGWHLLIRRGGQKLFDHQVSPPNASIGQLALSRDGTEVAFMVQRPPPAMSGEPMRHALLAMRIDGSARREIIGILGPVVGGSWGEAWSHDNGKLAVVAHVMGYEPGLVVLDPSASRVRTVFTSPGSIGMTTQAWSPDGRLVYSDGNAEVVIADGAGRITEKLGRGARAAWSPDGRFVAYEDFGERRGDYVIVDLARRERRTILSDPKTDLQEFWAGGSYSGAPVWSPDGRYLLVPKLTGPYHADPYVVELATGRVAALPKRSMGDMESWGGRP